MDDDYNGVMRCVVWSVEGDPNVTWRDGDGEEVEPQSGKVTSKKAIRTRYLGHVTGYQPFRDQYFLIRSVPGEYLSKAHYRAVAMVSAITNER